MKRKASVRKAPGPPASQKDDPVFFSPLASIFINYRRDDSSDEAAYLRAILSRHFGAEKIFRDVDSIKLGANFPEVINTTIAGATVVITLIGKKWLTVKRQGKPRIMLKDDYVRTEIESALQLGKTIIPVYLNGVQKLEKISLPPSISKLATLNAVKLSWFEGTKQVVTQIKEIEKSIEAKKAIKKEEAKKLNLKFDTLPRTKNSKGSGKGVVITAMEYSLERLGKKISLDENDFYRLLEKYEDKDLKGTGAFMFEDMIYVVDLIGVKAKSSGKRYIARSIPLRSLDDIPLQLSLNRPVICGFNVYEDWFDKNISKTGFIGFAKPSGAMQGGTVGVIISWDPSKEEFKLLTPWPDWGKKGVATITKEAMQHSLQSAYLRAVETIEKPTPYSPALIKFAESAVVTGLKKKPAPKRK